MISLYEVLNTSIMCGEDICHSGVVFSLFEDFVETDNIFLYWDGEE